MGLERGERREESDHLDQQNVSRPQIKAGHCSVWECLHISTVCKLKFILFKLINLSEINEVFSQGHPQSHQSSHLISEVLIKNFHGLFVVFIHHFLFSIH